MSHEHPQYNALLIGQGPVPKGNNGVFFMPRPGVQTLLEQLLHTNMRIIKATELKQETATMQAVMYKDFLHNPDPLMTSLTLLVWSSDLQASQAFQSPEAIPIQLPTKVPVTVLLVL